jgi:hypothetical protein
MNCATHRGEGPCFDARTLISPSAISTLDIVLSTLKQFLTLGQATSSGYWSKAGFRWLMAWKLPIASRHLSVVENRKPIESCLPGTFIADTGASVGASLLQVPAGTSAYRQHVGFSVGLNVANWG